MAAKDAESRVPGRSFLIKRTPNLKELGSTGLEQFGGRINEEWLRQLQDERGRRVYREMADNDATIGAILFAIEMLIRNVEWRVEAFSEDPRHVEEAEFVESLIDDMSISWEDFLAEVLSMLVYGFAPFEIVYKRRGGPTERDPTQRSGHTDQRIGWRKLAIRSQTTLDRWEFDPDDGGIAGMHQMDSYSSGAGPAFIPIEKLLIFRTTSRRSNPEGRSVLRNAFVSWYHKTRIQESEATGIERDLAGMPMFYLPPELFEADAPADVRAQYAEYQKTVESIKRDEQGGLLVPSQFDEHGNRTVEFKLIGTGQRRMIDTTGVIRRYNQDIAQTVLADFILLGHEKVGSFALSSDKTTLFASALGAWLKSIAAVLNRHALPRLYEVNGMNLSTPARFVPGDIEDADIDKFAEAVERFTGTGWLTPGGENDESYIRERLNMPEQIEEPRSRPQEDTDNEG